MNSFGENLKKLRIEKGLSQKELAKKAGINPTAVSMYETDRRMPKYETMERFAKGLDVDVAKLYQLAKDDPKIVAFARKRTLEEAGMTVKEISEILKLDYGKLILYYNGEKDAITESEAEKVEEYLYEQLMQQIPHYFDATDVRLHTEFSKLNEEGKEVAIQRVAELSEIERYKAKLITPFDIDWKV